MMTIANSRESPERISSALPMHTVSLHSVGDFYVALPAVAGFRVSRQLPQSSLPTKLMTFWEASGTS